MKKIVDQLSKSSSCYSCLIGFEPLKHSLVSDDDDSPLDEGKLEGVDRKLTAELWTSDSVLLGMDNYSTCS